MAYAVKLFPPENQTATRDKKEGAQSTEDPLGFSDTKVIEFDHYRKSPPAENKIPEEIVYFPITVDNSLSTDAQNILKLSCGDSLGALKVEPIPRKHQSKIWISMNAHAYGIALHAIILSLPSAELGLVIHMSANQLR